MKHYLFPVIIVFVLIAASCKKDHLPCDGKDPGPGVPRKVRYELYTNKDFSHNPQDIQFRLRMQDADGFVYDSLLAPMKIADIPDSLHRIIVERLVPGNNPARLTVGFVYQIPNVGISWHLENFEARDTLKVVRFAFE